MNLQKLDKFHKTRPGYAAFGLVELLMAYGFVDWALDTGGLWWWWTAAAILVASGLYNLFLAVWRRPRGGAKKMTAAKTKQQLLDELKARIEKDDPTPELRKGATQLVFGDGNPQAAIVFIGEAPGKNEDEQGKPFVGAAGKFLNEMLEMIGMQRQDIYITNIVKYRPPNNRDPHPAEKEAFLPYLQEQLDIIGPKLIVTLGRHSMDVLLPGLKISQVHGQPKRYHGIVYLPLFHPAAALYNGGMRQTLIDDFALIPAILKKINPSNKEGTN